jgi:hypothetical protein
MNLINETEARDRLHLPEHTLKRLRRLNQGPRWLRIGRVVFYDINDLDAWIQASTHTPQSPAALPKEGADNE